MPARFTTTIDPSGRPAILGIADMPMTVDRFGWTDFAWDATARMRYCRAYCGTGAIHTSLFHVPGCAYATNQWIDRAIEILRRVNRGE